MRAIKGHTGESTGSIVSRSDDNAWPIIESALRDGGHLIRPRGMHDYYVRGIDSSDRRYNRSLSATRVKTLERKGVLASDGAERYELIV